MDAGWDNLGLYSLAVAAALGMGLSFMCNAVETGSYRLNRIRLRLLAEAGDRRAAGLLRLLQDLRGLIITILITNNLAHFIVTAAMTTILAETVFRAQSDLVVQLAATAIVTPILFAFCELLPKNVYVFEAEKRMLPLAGSVRSGYTILSGLGLVPALKGLSDLVLRLAGKRGAASANPFTPRQRLRALFRESAAEGVITGYQGELVEKVLSLRELPVRKVMIPLGHVASVPLSISREQFIEQLRRHSFSRLPVWEGSREHIVGILRVNDVLASENGAFDLGREMNREFVAIPPDLPVSQAMFRLRKARAAMAVVRDVKGRALGIVTIKDLVEEIVGELAAW